MPAPGAFSFDRGAHHDPRGGFRNPWAGPPARGGRHFLAWMLQRARRGEFGFRLRGVPPAPIAPTIAHPRAAPGDLRLTWVGHSTFLIQLGALNVLTDPMFGGWASPLPRMGVPRRVAPGIVLDGLPPIDIVLQSHDHYDHLDRNSVVPLARRFPDAVWFAPLRVGGILERWGVRHVVERDWFESADHAGATVTALPARHFSGRTPFDRNATLWCGWSIRASGRRLWFVGDTAHHPDFGAIAAQHGPFDAVLMPIGAYDPRWFMRPVHADPEEAVAAYADVRAAQPALTPTMVAMHWGTFVLTEEPIDEPPLRARAAWAARGFEDDALWIMSPGESRSLPGR